MSLENNFSIVVCTYNPNQTLLNRLLTAIRAILTTTQLAEVIIIDNCSSPAIEEIKFVQDFLLATPKSRCVIESKKGLSAARYRAIQEASAPIVVFFDDDNEPSPDYLQVLDSYFTEYPNVGVWGPGHIAVEYVDPVNSWIKQHPEKFQQRQREFGYSCIPATWGPYSPNGTGFAVRREILIQYKSAIDQGLLRASGRKGKSLTSGEDVQIVWEGVKMGFAAGMIPELRCNHLITSKKANLEYLRRLEFGTASSYAPAILESFPQQATQLGQPPNSIKVYKYLIKFLIKMILNYKNHPEIQLEFASDVGRWYGSARALLSPRENHILSLAKRLKLV